MTPGQLFSEEFLKQALVDPYANHVKHVVLQQQVHGMVPVSLVEHLTFEIAKLKMENYALKSGRQ